MNNPLLTSFELTPGSDNRCQEFARSLAVVIGINDYRHGIPQLHTAVNDAQRLGALLQQEYGYDLCLVVEEATLTRLTTLFQELLPRQVGPQDRLLVYFAGHGIALDGDDGPEGFLIPEDAQPEDRSTFLAMTTLHEALIALPCRHLLMILDCCFAGAFRWASTRAIRLLLPPVLHRERYDRFVRDPAWQVITSAAYDQRALDVIAGAAVGTRGALSSAAGPHSPFAAALFEALSGAADLIPKGQGDGVITATELYLFLRDYVEVQAAEQAGHYQTPGLWPLRRHGKGEYIFLTPGHVLNLPPAPPLSAQNNPYRGLEPYNEDHADIFFGRAEQIRQLAGRVGGQPLTIVLGASGTGKSSLVKAGLAPHLRNQPKAWEILPPLRPGDAPIRGLAETVMARLGGDPVEPTPQAIIDRIVDWVSAHPDTRLLILVDQFEELITLCRAEEERLRFLTLLADLVEQEAEQVRVVLTLRTDFEPQFANSPLAPLWSASRFVVTPLTQAELREVIERPAAARVLFFEPLELVDQLIDEVIQTPGALPLLSFTLSELYLKYLQRQETAQREGVTIERALTAEDYRLLGGVIGSLRTRANEVFNGLDEAHQQTMQRIILRMVAVEGGELARRRVLGTELDYPSAEENRRVQAVIERMVAARLLVQGSADFNDDHVLDAYVEPAHDALVRAWDKLLLWRRAAADYLPLQRRLTQAAQEWAAASKDDQTGLLWDNDPGLPQVLPAIIAQSGRFGYVGSLIHSLRPAAELALAPAWLNRRESEFIAASVQRRTAVRRRVVGITAAVFVSLLALTLFAFIQRNRAQREAVVNQSTALAASAQQAVQNEDHDLAIALALAATNIDDPPALAINALAAAGYVPGTQRLFSEHQGEVTDIAFSPDGATALSGGLDKQAILWDVQSGAVLQRLAEDDLAPVTSVAYHPTATQALLGLEDASLLVWDLATGASSQRLQGHTSPIRAVAYGTDGRTALAGDADGGLIYWDLGAGTEIRRLERHETGISAVAINPEGDRALSGDDEGVLVLWDLAQGEIVREFDGHRNRILLAAFGPMEGYAISGGQDRRVRVWDLKSGEVAGGFNLAEHTQALGSMAVSADGVTLVSGAWDGSMLLWGGAVLGGLIRPFVGHRSPVVSLAYSPDGRHVLSGSRDGTIRLWDIGGPAQLERLTVERTLVSGQRIDTTHNLAVDSERRLALSGAFGAVILWNLDTGEELKRFPVEHNFLSAVAFSPDSAQALTGAMAEITLWELSTGRALHTLRGHEDQITNIVFSADGKTAFSADMAGMVMWWDVGRGEGSGRCSVSPPTGSTVWSVAFRPEQGQVLVGSEDTSVTLWDLTTCQSLRSFAGHQDAVYWVAVSPDGATGLTGAADRRVILWNLSTGEPIRHFAGHRLPVRTVAYSPDGQTILSGSEDKTIRWWDIASGAEKFRFTGHSSIVQNVLYLVGEDKLLSRDDSGSLIRWQFPPSDLASLTAWTQANRYVRDLTCDERTLYNAPPLCD